MWYYLTAEKLAITFLLLDPMSDLAHLLFDLAGTLSLVNVDDG